MHINQDTLRTRDKCLKAVEEALQEGQSCVVGQHFPDPTTPRPRDHFVTSIDNTNRDIATREYYVTLGKKFEVSIR